MIKHNLTHFLKNSKFNNCNVLLKSNSFAINSFKSPNHINRFNGLLNLNRQFTSNNHNHDINKKLINVDNNIIKEDNLKQSEDALNKIFINSSIQYTSMGILYSMFISYFQVLPDKIGFFGGICGIAASLYFFLKKPVQTIVHQDQNSDFKVSFPKYHQVHKISYTTLFVSCGLIMSSLRTVFPESELIFTLVYGGLSTILLSFLTSRNNSKSFYRPLQMMTASTVGLFLALNAFKPTLIGPDAPQIVSEMFNPVNEIPILLGCAFFMLLHTCTVISAVRVIKKNGVHDPIRVSMPLIAGFSVFYVISPIFWFTLISFCVYMAFLIDDAFNGGSQKQQQKEE
ncbi:hypothetical protein DICPUDRAFT_150371 [Dictyostelium purpureum]|uniref:Uncharacterized protein n=1 Tax=Dictyostelium purpureum TaxID=5786 RepID=F0ZG57_DICPU|nr:uncharacterized protein DICPUDRAFT_150371 [Dictyostelium purpureum]EGC37044.1 hypothetical protein DICPUDRAFT_150371 [Dictyostelium purpureum]|eukprot:XP_003286401.1 hypothetical protein DICPUDRAFT_150371 [Dictyostelium purpureum]